MLCCTNGVVKRQIYLEWSLIECRLLWYCLAMLCDWLKSFVPPSQPIRSRTETNRDLLAHIFPCLVPVTCVYFEF